MSFGDFDIDILACNSAKISTQLLDVESGFKIFIMMVGIVLESYVYKAASTVGFSPAFLMLTKDWFALRRGVKKVEYESWVIIECSHDLISEWMNGGMRSVLVGFALAIALVMTVVSVVRSRFVGGFILTIPTEGGMWFEWFIVYIVVVVVLLVFFLTDENLVEGFVISYIDDILAEDSKGINIFLLCTIFFPIIVGSLSLLEMTLTISSV